LVNIGEAGSLPAASLFKRSHKSVEVQFLTDIGEDVLSHPAGWMMCGQKTFFKKLHFCPLDNYVVLL
jgi:hypothetical protein